jgi:PAS domain S-box-containing protein
LLASVTNYVYSVALGPERAQATTHGPGCEAVTGYTSQEFEADPFLWYRMIFSEDRPAVMAQIERVLAGETPAPLEHRIVHRDGRLRWIRNAPVPHRDEQGRLIAYDGLVSDITERKRAELALRESQERLALVIEGSNDGIWDWDLTTDEVYYSPRWKAMLGYDNHELPNRYSSWEQLLHPADRERSLASLQAYLSGQTATFELEHRLRHKDGNYRWILARGVALRDAQGKPIRMAGSHVDLTAHKEAAEKLEKAYRELSKNEASLRIALEKLKAANKELRDTQLQLIQAAKLESVGTLAAGVAREVKNPLQTILMGVDYLENSGGGGDRNSIQLVLNNMRAAVTRANSIVRELLMLSAPTDFKPQAEDLNALIERSLWLISNEIVASHTRVVRNLAADLPSVMLDRGKMEQVFINLFINALQAMSQGGTLTVSTRLSRFGQELQFSGPAFARFTPGEPMVIAEVQDTGKGIPDADLQKVFDPFFTTKPTGVGTGLGLSVVKKILDLHGDAIVIRNAPSGGVVVTLVLGTEPEAEPRQENSVRGSGGGGKSPDRRGGPRGQDNE